jgi:hypothetical protein
MDINMLRWNGHVVRMEEKRVVERLQGEGGKKYKKWKAETKVDGWYEG